MKCYTKISEDVLEIEPEVVDAAKELKVGTYTTTPVKSSYGYHIVYLKSQDKKPELNDDVTNKIKTIVGNEIAQEPNFYVKALKADYESKLQAERSDANRVANELSLVKRKLEKYETDYIAKQEKVASALITAEDQAKKIIENSRSEAIQEKDRIEHLIEMEKEKLLDMKREVIDLKEKTVGLLDKYSQEINNLLD